MDKIYHLSEENLDGKTLQPRIPNNFLVKNGFEEGKTPRVSFSKSVGGSLMGISNNLSGKVFYIHTPDGDVDYYEPTVDEVPDVKCTHEVWVKQPVKLKLHKIIKVTSAQDKPLHYKYGSKIADTYKWNYDYVTESMVNDIHHPLTVSSTSTTNPNDPVSHKAVHLDFYNKDEHIGQVFISSVDTNNGFIYNLVVFKKYRGQGYGKEIMEYVLSHYDVRELTVTADNTIAIGLYKGMGFKLKKTFNDPQTHNKMLWMRCPESNRIGESTEPSTKESESFAKSAICYVKERGRCDMNKFEGILYKAIMESEMSADVRNELDNFDFGLPKKRKYPMPDKQHVYLAIRYFNYADSEDKEILAKNIIKKVEDFDMKEVKIGSKNSLKNFIDFKKNTRFVSNMVANESTKYVDKFERIFFEKSMAERQAEREAKFQKLLDKLGIKKFLKTQRIGFSEKDQKWYGFGLAYKGYGVGDKCKKDEFGLGDKFTFKEGDVLKTLDDCKQRAIDHVKDCTP